MSSHLSLQDKTTIKGVRDVATELSTLLRTSATDFGEKGGIGLWWDAKGLFNSSNRDEVLGEMNLYKEVYEEVVSCMKLVESDDENAYKKIQEYYKKLEKFEKTAKDHVEGESKAVCKVALDFLKNNLKLLDHKLRKVECVVLNNRVRKVRKEAEKRLEEKSRNNEDLKKSNQELKQSGDVLQNENQELKQSVDVLQNENQEMKQSVDVLQNENQEMKQSVDVLQKENQELRKEISESEARTERRIQELMRHMERMMGNSNVANLSNSEF